MTDPKDGSSGSNDGDNSGSKDNTSSSLPEITMPEFVYVQNSEHGKYDVGGIPDGLRNIKNDGGE